MKFGTAIFTVLLNPLQLIFEFIYNIAYKNINDPGLAIIALSLAINFLVLPLYMRADKMQQEECDTEKNLNKWVTHIKKTFHGDERTMMLQTYYRQNNYSPTHVLRSAASLLLEIPFFIAAYRFLSGLELLEGVSFGAIADLSQPDSLLIIGSIHINVLPILMTIINIISSSIFSKDYPVKTKVQLYSMALFFLVFLYNSPSGLVFYWTLNNAFSLIKTIFYKLKNAKRVLCVISVASGLVLILFAIKKLAFGEIEKFIILTCFGILFLLPLIIYVFKKSNKFNIQIPEFEPSTKNFVLATILLAILTGILIPSSVINASPQEFIYINYFVHPLWYLVYSFLISIGFFVLWFGVFYWLASNKAKIIFEYTLWAFCGIAITDYMFFGTNLGNISSDLIYDEGLSYSTSQILINTDIVILIAGIFAIVFIKFRNFIPSVLSIAVVTFICMSTINCVQIQKSINSINFDNYTVIDSSPHFTLSKTGNNVVVIMLDRAMGEYIPFILNEKPELKEQFSGFTYYSNTISFGGHTNFATPALFGGYEYTPVELNKRNTELLKDKQNEALKVMPVLFDSNGYNTTVFDPPYANYNEIPDLSIYDDYSGINSYITEGYFTDVESIEDRVEQRNRNFFCYGFTKSAPLFLQNFLYANGHYNQISESISVQLVESPNKSLGISNSFMRSYYVLQNMQNMTRISDNEQGTFLMMDNEITHNSTLLSEPDYLPSIKVDNSEYDKLHSDRFTLNGCSLKVQTSNEYGLYQTNVAALIQLGIWFDYLKENNVYDNTRIIIVSDHGYGLAQMDDLVLDSDDYQRGIDARISDIEFYYPLLMVKDFNSASFTTSDEFMTNADVPTLAVEGLFNNPINPMTGKALNNSEKFAHEQYIIASPEYNISTNNGTTFNPASWYSVHDSICDKENWTLVAENAVLPIELVK